MNENSHLNVAVLLFLKTSNDFVVIVFVGPIRLRTDLEWPLFKFLFENEVLGTKR